MEKHKILKERYAILTDLIVNMLTTSNLDDTKMIVRLGEQTLREMLNN